MNAPRPKRRKSFFSGYGGAGADIAFSASPPSPKLERVLLEMRTGLFYVMALTAVFAGLYSLTTGLRAPLPIEWAQRCSWSPIDRVLLLTHGSAAVVFLALTLYEFRVFPYAELPLISRRITNPMAHLGAFMGGLLLSALLVGLLVSPAMFCSFKTSGLGHGSDLMHLMTTSSLGMTLLEPFFWAGAFLFVWFTFVLGTTGLYRVTHRPDKK